MANNLIPFVLPLGNVGWATDLPLQTRQLTHYLTAENVIYEQSIGVRKVGGNTRINSTALTGTPKVTGMFDFWRAGTGGTFTQKHVIMTSDSKIYKDDMDGTYDDITGTATITASAIPVFCQARDLLLIFDSKNDTPLKWNQTGNVAALGGTPPFGRGSIFHTNRAWAWGTNANPSRLYYSSSTDVEDWSGADTGSIDIEPEDGDRIVGCCVYKKTLIVFKGPNKGSIHMIGGTAPTGSDAYNRTPLVGEIALQTHNSIIGVGDDKWFMSNRGIHSLSATQQYGNFQGAFLTRFLTTFFRRMISRSGLDRVWGCNYSDKSCALWTLAGSGSSTNNRTLGLSYIRLQEDGVKPFLWTRGGESCGIRINPSSKLNEVVFGGATGFVTLEDQTARSLAPNTAYSMRLTTPALFFAEADRNGKPNPYGIGTLHDMALRSVSTGNWDVNVSVQRDTSGTNSLRFNQGNNLTTTGGFTLGTSRLGVDSLGGGGASGGPQIAFAGETGNELSGEARSITLDITQGGLNEDAHLFEGAIFWTPSGRDLNSSLES